MGRGGRSGKGSTESFRDGKRREVRERDAESFRVGKTDRERSRK